MKRNSNLLVALAVLSQLILGLIEFCLAEAPPSIATTAQSTIPQSWSSLASRAAQAESQGDHHRSLELANEALKIGRSDNSDFETGRSLILIALALRGLGFYDLAIEFFRQAIALGAPGGKITIVPVWGYATQELGAVYLQRGELDEASKLIEETYSFAEEHGVTVGIAEGGAHLAEIALKRGDIERAKKYATLALQAARDCKCSALNTARAMVVVARVAVLESQTNPVLKESARNRIEEALRYAEASGIKRYLAEGKMLLSQALPESEIDRKIELASSAFELLEASEDELRGTAEAQIGNILVAGGQEDAAQFYLRNGLRVNRDLFRKLDNGYIFSDLAAIQALKGQDKETAKSLRQSADAATASGAWPLALESDERLGAFYTAQGYFKLGYKWTMAALQALARLQEIEKDEARKAVLLQRELVLRQRLFEIGVYFSKTENTAQ